MILTYRCVAAGVGEIRGYFSQKSFLNRILINGQPMGRPPRAAPVAERGRLTSTGEAADGVAVARIFEGYSFLLLLLLLLSSSLPPISLRFARPISESALTSLPRELYNI